MSSYKWVPRRSAADLKAHLGNGPVSVPIEADQLAFQLYKDGVLDMKHCFHNMLNHVVLAVGYGSENGLDYYIVKNSWGTSWGMQGYVKIAAQDSGPGACGIQMEPVQPYS